LSLSIFGLLNLGINQIRKLVINFLMFNKKEIPVLKIDKSILISIPWFTPAYKAGGPVQSVLNMVSDSIEGVFFDIATADKDIDGSLLKIVSSDNWIKFNSQTNVFYSSEKDSRRKLKRLFTFLQNDICFIIGIYSFSFTIFPLLFNKSSRKILSVRGMLHPPALQQKSLKKKIYLSLLKPILKLKNVEFHATDEDERNHILSLMGNKAKIWVAPNFPRMIEKSISPKNQTQLKLLTVALIGPMKNHLEVLKALSEIKVDIEYDICGSIYWPEYWAECLQLIKALPSNIKVNYHGAITPENLIPYYHNTNIFICPSQSENFGHAIFEAFSAGKPVITSFNTPWKNLEEKKIGINVSPKKDDIKKSVEFFCTMNSEEYMDWSHRAAEFARSNDIFLTAKKSYKEMFT